MKMELHSDIDRKRRRKEESKRSSNFSNIVYITHKDAVGNFASYFHSALFFFIEVRNKIEINYTLNVLMKLKCYL